MSDIIGKGKQKPFRLRNLPSLFRVGHNDRKGIPSELELRLFLALFKGSHLIRMSSGLVRSGFLAVFAEQSHAEFWFHEKRQVTIPPARISIPSLVTLNLRPPLVEL